jgi:hypothetical protein
MPNVHVDPSAVIRHMALQQRADAVLGAELVPVVLDDPACSPSEAVRQALRVWAPAAQVRAIRLVPADSPPLAGAIMTARVYARCTADDGDITLQVSAKAARGGFASVMVDLRLEPDARP